MRRGTMFKRLLYVAACLFFASPAFGMCLAPDDGSDATPALQACINNDQGGGTLHLAKGETGIYSLQTGYNASAVLRIAAPIKIVCDPGVWLKPSSEITAAQSILYFVGTSVGSSVNHQEPTIVEGCNIGDPTSTVRFGNHGIVFDTASVAGALFKRPVVRDVMVAAASTGRNSCLQLIPTGCAIYGYNSSSNTTGGLVWATFQTSTLAGGVHLKLSGDSIALRDVVFPPNPLEVNASDFGVYADLIPGAGNLVIDKVNCQALAGCVVIDNAESATLRDVTFEAIPWPNTQPHNTMVEIGISTLVPSGMVGAVSISGGSIVSSDCANKPYLISYGRAIGGSIGGGVRLGHNCPSYPHPLLHLGVDSHDIALGSGIWWQKLGVTITSAAEKYTNYGTNNFRVVTTTP